MKRIDIKIGFHCNNMCKHCVQGDKRIHFPTRPFSEVKDYLIRGRKNADQLILTGGEPTLHKDILKIIETASNIGYTIIQIQSNGRLLAYKDFCKRIINAGVNEFGLALHGHIPQLHDFLTSSKGSFAQTVQGIKNLKSLGQRIMTNTVVDKPNYRHLPEIARLLVSLDVDQFQFAFPHITGSAMNNYKSTVPRKTLIMPYVKRGLLIGIEAGKASMTEAIPYCFMKDYEDFVVEKRIPDATIFDAEAIIEDYTKVRQAEGKAKGPQCPECKYYNVCEGPWKEYPELFGWDEFKPVMN